MRHSSVLLVVVVGLDFPLLPRPNRPAVQRIARAYAHLADVFHDPAMSVRVASRRRLLNVRRVAAVGSKALAGRSAIDDNINMLAAVMKMACGIDQFAFKVGSPSRVNGKGPLAALLWWPVGGE
jgi:hypothetical protein